MARFNAIYQKFSSRKVFTLEEVKSAFPDLKLPALYQQISYLLKRGYIGKVKRGLYYIIPPEAEAETFSPDALLIASKVTENAKLVYSGAILARGLYHNFPHVIRVTGSRRVPELTWGEFKIKFHKVPADNIGFERMGILDIPVAVAGEARIVVDGLFRPKFVGGFQEYLRVVDKIDHIDPEEVLMLALAYQRQGLMQKVGLILEINQQRWNVGTRVLEILERKKTSFPIPLDPSSEGRRLISRWNLWVNGRFLERVRE
jgi:predicted transcriptional regulator of viral defense system